MSGTEGSYVPYSHLPQPQLEKKEQSRQKAIKMESLKIVIKTVMCSTLQLLPSGVCGDGAQFSLRDWPVEVWPCSNEYMGNTN